jgi:hypothetical protein
MLEQIVLFDLILLLCSGDDGAVVSYELLPAILLAFHLSLYVCTEYEFQP